MAQQTENFEARRKALLNFYRSKQPFRVASGKSKWINYESFCASYNLREILDDEVVVEFDIPDRNFTWLGINNTAINLFQNGLSFEIWDHGGKSPHLHIHDLPISHLEPEQRREFKKFFIKKFTPHEFLPYVDMSLAGIHLVALEWQNHWKGKYGVKILINKFNPQEK